MDGQADSYTAYSAQRNPFLFISCTLDIDIRIYHECEGGIENPSRGSLFASRGLPSDDKW